ncbi:MAG: hypothetical protein US70_C0015G0017 [Parcubacteria group bacterium GW2011_GWD2_38_11]|nr:MAG: hypothetical protein US70_C0015G0017 [Parcubacteria group bacterium GW2011_GWD2_38_11]
MSATRTSGQDFENETDISLNTIVLIIAYANTLMQSIVLPKEIADDIKKGVRQCTLIMQSLANYPDDLTSYDLMDEPEDIETGDIYIIGADEFLSNFVELLNSYLEDYGEGPDFIGQFAILVTPPDLEV